MKSRKAVFESGTPLPENVYHAPRQRDKNKLFRYRTLDGKMISFRPTPEVGISTEEQVIGYAKEANDKILKGYSIRRASKKIETTGYTEDEFGHWVKKHFEKLDLARKMGAVGHISDRHYYGVVKGVNKIFKSLLDRPTHELEVKDFSRAWETVTHSTQKRLRSHLVRIISLAVTEGRLPGHAITYFSPAGSGGFEYSPKRPKIRNTLSEDLFKEVRQTAKEMGYQCLVDAMNISFLTFLRIGDVLTLSFDDFSGGHLEKVIGKSEGLAKPKKHGYSLDVHGELKRIVSSARLRRSVNNPCPFVIHHIYKQKRQSKQKVHPSQVLPGALNDFWNECMDQIIEKKGLEWSRAEAPSFHEIRALRKFKDDNQRKLDDISKDMAHSSPKITDSAYGTHQKFQHHEVTYAPKLI